jgi:prephenate dehydrogenase
MPSAAPRALVAGLGLIGGSIGQALRARGWQITYIDPNVDLQQAQRARAADTRAEDVRGAEIVIIATPVDVALEMLASMTPVATTSVCSVMAPLRTIADQRKIPFVAGHPLAGSQNSGLAAAQANLFAGKTWFVDREEPLVSRVIHDCGANMEVVDPDVHDRAIAVTSHLPQLLSTALGALVDDRGDPKFAGTGLAAFLRLAGSEASVWNPVFDANHENIAASLQDLLRIAEEVLEGDAEAFTRAKRALARLSR